MSSSTEGLIDRLHWSASSSVDAIQFKLGIKERYVVKDIMCSKLLVEWECLINCLHCSRETNLLGLSRIVRL